ncbi:hypothetical protein CCHL11_00639 [Colletotrichum chlorophyti]|uniref:Uncharacterized protein n=1 Tax=Colletotrichum chlorophyti TaxID=708187 RepID=A0A1Q8S530_9PEZI|nr:hypothetical protein CCHL11_00639 [Colletotrichum chlorophyti]
MISARPQHVTSTLRHLSPPPHSNNFLPLLVRFSRTPCEASKQPPVLLHQAFQHSLARKPAPKYKKQIFNELDIGSHDKDLLRAPLPKGKNAKNLVRVRYSTRHVMRTYDAPFLSDPLGEREPRSVVLRHYYEEKKKTEPLWLWFYGNRGTDTPCVVSLAKRRVKRALHASLLARGYDAQGRTIERKDGAESMSAATARGDLTGTIVCNAEVPRSIVKGLLDEELRAAMDAVVDMFIDRCLSKPKVSKPTKQKFERREEPDSGKPRRPVGGERPPMKKFGRD